MIFLIGGELLGYYAPEKSSHEAFKNIEYLGVDQNLLEHFSSSEVELVNGIGMLPGNMMRQKIYNLFSGYNFATLIHPSATVSLNASLSEGVQVMAGAVIQNGTTIEKNVIINTKSSIDHGCNIGAHTHIAVGATLCGDVHIA